MANGIPDTIEPINPTYREMVRQGIFDLLSRDNQDELTRQRNLRRAESLAGVLDFIPGYSETADVSDAKRDFSEGRYGSGLLSLGTAALGAVPLVGDAAAGVVRKGIRAYHGSPYTFDRFDLSRIGRGEGAQAYGHGLYFTENPEIARGYRDNVKDNLPDMKIGNKDINEMYDRLTSARASDLDYQKAAILEQIMIDGDVEGVLSRGKDMYGDKAFDWFKKDVEPNFNRTGSMYEVNLNADPQGLLDWDKPLSQQSAKVQEAIQNLPEIKTLTERGVDYKDLTGEQLYSLISNSRGNRDYGASQGLLNEAGVPGIRYLDGMSRGAGEGSSNYVMFDDNLIELMRRYGIALPTGLLGYGMVRGQNNEAQ